MMVSGGNYQQVTDTLYCTEYTSTLDGFKLTNLMVIGTESNDPKLEVTMTHLIRIHQN